MPNEIGGAQGLAISGLNIANQSQANLGAAVIEGLENAAAIASSAGGTASEGETASAATPPAPPSESGRGTNLDISV